MEVAAPVCTRKEFRILLHTQPCAMESGLETQGINSAILATPPGVIDNAIAVSK